MPKIGHTPYILVARFWLTKRIPRMCGKQVEADERKIAP